LTKNYNTKGDDERKETIVVDDDDDEIDPFSTTLYLLLVEKINNAQ
jgi:hypothetical protein